MELGLYLHVPFCVRKCPYCDFFSVEGEPDEELYLRALLEEIELFKEFSVSLFGADTLKIITFYVGGGTPSLLSPKFYHRVIEKLLRVFDFRPLELTLEVNPETLRIDWLKGYKELGFNRISLGVQSFSSKGLRFLERRHEVKDIILAIEMIRSVGIDNLSLDFIYGWKGQGRKTLLREISLALEFSPPHLSFYELTIYPGTKFFKRFFNDSSFERRSERCALLWRIIDEFLEGRGYRHYEISNFAWDNFECRHNLLYWRFEPYLGLGAGAVSRIGDIRFQNPEDLSLYFRALFEENRLPYKIIENFSKTDKIREIIFMGLRMSEGICLSDLRDKYGLGIREEAITLLCDKGLSQLEGDRLKLTKRGWLLHSKIVAYLWENIEEVR